MGSVTKCFLQITKSFIQGHCARTLVTTYALSQNLHFNKLLILSTRAFIYYQSHASPDSRQKNPPSTVEEKREREVDADRLKKLADILDCSVGKAQMFCMKHDFLIEIDLDKLQVKVDLMLSYGVPYSVIQTHLRVAKHVSPEILSQRLQLLHKLSLLNHRSAGFYLYCTKTEFERGVSYVLECRQALDGCADTMEYIQHRLNVSEVKAKNLLSSCVFKKGYSPMRLKRLFDFFHFEAKVDSEYLLQNFVLFNYSSERLRHRLKIMRRAGIKEPYIWNKFWRCTSHEFNQMFAQYVEEPT